MQQEAQKSLGLLVFALMVRLLAPGEEGAHGGKEGRVAQHGRFGVGGAFTVGNVRGVCFHAPMTSLAAILDEMRAASAAKIPAEKQAVMKAAKEELLASGAVERAVGTGDRMPAFQLYDTRGVLRRSDELLARGPLVLTFFRGQW